MARYLGWRPAKALEYKELEEFLLARAMEHDSPSLLFRMGCEYLRSAQVIRPGVVTLLEKVASARQAAEAETHARVAHLLTDETCQGLDSLLVVEPKLCSTRLHWMVTGPVQASPNSVKDEVEKLLFLRRLGADALDLSALPAERRRYLAQVGRRLTAQALVRREPNRRHPILLTLLAQSPWSSASCPRPPGRTRSPQHSRSTGPFVARSTRRNTCRTRATGARSPDS